MTTLSNNLPKQESLAITHDHMMYGLAMRRSRGERAVFSNYYAPLVRQGGVAVIGLVVGGDPPFFWSKNTDPWWGSLSLIDMLWQEAEESHDTLRICLNCTEIDEAVTQGKIAVLMTMEGGLPLFGGADSEPLVNLRMLNRLGLRSLQFVGQDWNLLADAKGRAHPSTSNGLTQLGKEVVQEMNRLSMLIDMAHVPDPDPFFWDVMEISQYPIIDSHRGVRGANDVPRNISDERVKAIADKGGVIGLQFFSETLGSARDGQATVDDLMRHVDYLVKIAGIDSVALGPDFLANDLIHRAPGHYSKGIDEISKLSRVTEALVRHGYSVEDRQKILGENILRVYRQVIG